MTTTARSRASRGRRACLLGAALLALAGLTLTSSPATPVVGATAASAASVHRKVSGWIPYWDNAGGYQDALRNASLLHTVSPFWYQSRDYRSVTGLTGAGSRTIIDGLHAKHIKVVPTVTETMSAATVAAVLAGPTSRRAHVDALVAVARSRPYDGLELDYETMAIADRATADKVRSGFELLVRDLCTRLHAYGKTCVVTVMPRTSDTTAYWRTRFATWVYDYATIGRYADRVRVMGYHLHGPNELPGPMSTPAWYDQVLRYTTAKVPRWKVELALPAYGYDWVAGTAGTGRSRTWKSAEALRRAEGAPRRWNSTWQAPWFTYLDRGVRRVVVYENAAGTGPRVDVAKRYGIAGTALWALNFEDPGTWSVLRGRYTY